MAQLLLPDWDRYGTKEQIERSINHHFKVRLGWTETPHHTIYCEEAPKSSKVGTPDEQHYHIYVWNNPGIRLEIAKLLLEPVHKED